MNILGNMRRDRAGHLAAVPGCLALVLALASPGFVRADVSVLVPGGSSSILTRSGDPMYGGGTLRGALDKIYWFPSTEVGVGDLFVNHELTVPNGGMSRLHYKNGVIVERRSWVTGTHFNCSGSTTWWGTILSCEEHPPAGNDTVGYVVEVVPYLPDLWVRRPAMGRFSHESVIMDPGTGVFYLTDDSYTGAFFKFVPVIPGYLGAGSLYAFREPTHDWVQVTDMVATESQAISLGATTYPRPEDLAYNPVDDAIYIMITGRLSDPASRLGYILRYDPRAETMERWLDCDGTVLANPDNVEVDSWGNLLVHEDQYPENNNLYGPNELLLVHLDRTIDPILVGLDLWGEPSGLEFSDSDDLFWVNWMGGANGSELIEIRCPPGWNVPPTGVPLPAPPPPALEFELVAAPNPFGSTTRLVAEVEPGADVRLEIFDVRGARWRTLIDGPLASGRLDAVWDGRDERSRRAPRGAYYARLVAGGRAATVPLMLAR